MNYNSHNSSTTPHSTHRSVRNIPCPFSAFKLPWARSKTTNNPGKTPRMLSYHSALDTMRHYLWFVYCTLTPHPTSSATAVNPIYKRTVSWLHCNDHTNRTSPRRKSFERLSRNSATRRRDCLTVVADDLLAPKADEDSIVPLEEYRMISSSYRMSSSLAIWRLGNMRSVLGHSRMDRVDAVHLSYKSTASHHSDMM